MQYGFKKAPPIAELLMRSATANVPNLLMLQDIDLLIAPQLEGIELRDWKAFDQAVEAGYRATTRALQATPAHLRFSRN